MMSLLVAPAIGTTQETAMPGVELVPTDTATAYDLRVKAAANGFTDSAWSPVITATTLA